MLHRYLSDVSDGAVNQAYDLRKRPAIFDNLIDNEPSHHFKAGQINLFWLAQHNRGNPVVKPASSISKPGMLLVDVMSVNHVEFSPLQFRQHRKQFLRWV